MKSGGFSMNLNKLNESQKPDFPDVDGDGDREEPISKAQKIKKKKVMTLKKISQRKKQKVKFLNLNNLS